jgi:hypothetical protein
VVEFYIDDYRYGSVSQVALGDLGGAITHATPLPSTITIDEVAFSR